MAATKAVAERYKRQRNEQESTEVEAAWGSSGRGETEVTATGTAKTGLVDCGSGEKEATAVVQWQRRFLILLRSCVMVCGCVGVVVVNVLPVVLGAM